MIFNPVVKNGGSSEDWIGDGNTHIWIHLVDGRTSPILGCCPNGTVTVDWGDGTEKDTLTGTSITTVMWTPTHNYANPGDYIVTLTIDGEAEFTGSSSLDAYSYILRHSKDKDPRNLTYQNAIHKIELGSNITSIGSNAFNACKALSNIFIPNSVTAIKYKAFTDCGSLLNIVIPNSVTTIDGFVFQYCNSLQSVTIPNSVTSIGQGAFQGCSCLLSVVIPDGMTSIIQQSLFGCQSLANVVATNNITSIGKQSFYNCVGVRFYDFTANTSVPTLENSNAFYNIPKDCEIRVPASLYNEWKAATNWATYASQIVSV